MAYFNLEYILQLWESWGLMDVILPFLLIFAVVFAAAEKGKLLGDNKRTHVIVALVMALAVIIPHVTYTYPAGADVVNIINSALPQIALVIIAVLMLMILTGMIGAEWDALKTVVGIFSIIAIIYIFARSADVVSGYRVLYWLDDPTVQSIVIILLVFGLAIWLITAGPKEAFKFKLFKQ